jgi:hypothetical protein
VGGVPLGKLAVKLTKTLVPTGVEEGGGVFQPLARADVAWTTTKRKIASRAKSLEPTTGMELSPRIL